MDQKEKSFNMVWQMLKAPFLILQVYIGPKKGRNIVFNISPFDIKKYNTRYETSVYVLLNG